MVPSSQSEPAEWLYHVELVCEDTKETRVKLLKLDSQPYTFLDIKKGIERSFSIPVCVQSLLHLSSKVADSESLESYYVRIGDTFQVAYPIEGDCEGVVEAVRWVKRLKSAFFQMIELTRTQSLGAKHSLGFKTYHMLLSRHLVDVARDLCGNPWVNSVNKLHFDSLDGVRQLMDVYQCCVKARLNKVNLYGVNSLETLCASFVANFTQTFPLRRRIIEHGGLDLVVSTFMMSPVRKLGNSPALRAVGASLRAVCR